MGSYTLYVQSVNYVFNIPNDKVLAGEGELLSHTISKDWSVNELLQLLVPARWQGVRRNLSTGERGSAENKMMKNY